MLTKMRLLVVRPLGGLNDSLCQVEYARTIAQRTNRVLAVQTELAYPNHSHSFGQSFDSIFRFVDNTPAVTMQLIKSQLGTFETVFPSMYENSKNLVTKTLMEITSGEKKFYRLPKDCQNDADILVHESAGGGPLGALLLGRIEVSSRLMQKISSTQIRALGSACGIHFRNSDYKSDYSALSKFVSRLKSSTPVVIASDDKEVLPFLSKAFPNHSFLSARSFVSDYIQLTSTEKAIMDLLVLSFCKNLAVVPLSKENRGPRYSGFGRLAKQLWAVRKIRVEGLFAFLKAVITFSGLGRRRRGGRLSITALLGGANIKSVFNQVRKPSGVYLQIIQATEKSRL